MMSDLITISNPKSPVAEAYRTLRTNIQFSNVDGDLQTICVTSSGPGEGKSTTISNLAETFAQAGNKVVLLDCDLRKPHIHKIFKLVNTKGVTTLLSGQGEIEDVTQITESELTVITSGPIPPNPSELLGSKRMKNLLDDLKKIYDIILIDAPPVGLVTDAALLSAIVDGIILVVASGKTDIDGAKRAKQLLENVGARILGVTMTMIPVSKKGYYGYQYYGYYEENESKKKGRN
ncbi:CpsD/CapB family tyrosine-protein kinase [Turicibacter sanguinis]|uniref:CpsD/CapB family tyrosine-protein kinase n=1 Tax=Turicibacter sanguinis TaxID=154288 RepID=UPI0018AB88B9|nr:CpsD/CapB family tyrosine-protein kinase [Turicibacter sanguinis]MDB8551628.1 CpsD/CapB family tyrosine-protein kinase [Turicibacter sanguinis]